MAKVKKAKYVVFVTGAFVNNSCWKEWQQYFKKHGYTTIAPAWPYKDGTTKELRDRQPHDIDLATLTLKEVIDSYAKAIKALPEKPIIIGHSLGGLITQVLINRGLGLAGVAIHSIPPLGVFPYEFSFLKAGWKSLGFFTSTKKTYLMSFEDWQYAFVNGMPYKEQRAAYDTYTIPESKTVARGGLTKTAAIDWDKEHAPLLLTSGGEDTITPRHLNMRNYQRYLHSKTKKSVVDFKDFPGRNHFVLGQKTWKEDADYILTWLANIVKNQ